MDVNQVLKDKVTFPALTYRKNCKVPKTRIMITCFKILFLNNSLPVSFLDNKVTPEIIRKIGTAILHKGYIAKDNP